MHLAIIVSYCQKENYLCVRIDSRHRGPTLPVKNFGIALRLIKLMLGQGLDP